MALVKCPDCGSEVSTMARTCPQCGCPVAQEQRHKDSTVLVEQAAASPSAGNRVPTPERSTGLTVVSAIIAALSALGAIGVYAMESDSGGGAGAHIVSIGLLIACVLCIFCLLLSTSGQRVAASVVGIIAGLATFPLGLLLVGFSIAALTRKTGKAGTTTQ